MRETRELDEIDETTGTQKMKEKKWTRKGQDQGYRGVWSVAPVIQQSCTGGGREFPNQRTSPPRGKIIIQ